MNFQFYTRYIPILTGVLLLLCNCKPSPDAKNQSIDRGNKVYGGEIRLSSPEKISIIFPAYSTSRNTERINSQIFETLFRIDFEQNDAIPCIAKSIQSNKEATIFLIKLRSDVLFHEDKCFKNTRSRLLTSNDVKFTLQLACSDLYKKKTPDFLSELIEGAYNLKHRSISTILNQNISGIKIIDNQTIEIKLSKPFTAFPKLLSDPALGIISNKAFEFYGKEILKHPLGTGPFQLENLTGDGIRLIKNKTYWRHDQFGNRLPFIDTLSIKYYISKKSELKAFWKNQTDFVIGLPVNEIEHILGSFDETKAKRNIRHRVYSKNSYKVYYLGFNCKTFPFQNSLIRLGFSQSINKKGLMNDWLSGEGSINENGLTPKIGSYLNEGVIETSFNPNIAKSISKKWGIKNLTLYSDTKKGTIKHRLCLGIIEQVKKSLQIKMNLILCNTDQLHHAIFQDKAHLWISDKTASYPDATSFLSLFYDYTTQDGENHRNIFHYNNMLFDSLFNLANAKNSSRNDLLKQCNQLIVNDCPIIPIINDNFILLANARVRNLKINSFENIDFSTIFIHESKQNGFVNY